MDRWTDQFERCWHDNVQHVTAYARRHVGREAAGDIASATFLTAWRAGRQVPSPALPWLPAVAKGHIRNHFRTQARQRRLTNQLELLEACAADASDASVSAAERSAPLHALASLSTSDREALLLVTWDGLTTEQAAAVLGCRPGAPRTRLHRARQRLNSISIAAQR
jgi:RNA polymerase sigma-70 factor (ECF subfamily)